MKYRESRRTTFVGNDDKRRRQRRRTHQSSNALSRIVHLLFPQIDDFGPKTKQNTDEDAFTAMPIQAVCQGLDQD